MDRSAKQLREADEEQSIGDLPHETREKKVEQFNEFKEQVINKGSQKNQREDKGRSNLAENYMVREISVDQIAHPKKKRLKQKSEGQSKKRPKTNIDEI